MSDVAMIRLLKLQDERLRQTEVKEVPLQNSGAAFPSSWPNNTPFFRTDLGWWTYYDGTRWLTAHDYTFQFPYTVYTVTTEDFNGLEKTPKAYVVYPLAWDYNVAVGATNNGANFWTVKLRAVGSATVNSFTTAAASPSTESDLSITTGFAGLTTADKYLNIRVETTGAPTPLGAYFQLRYKLIVP